MRLVRFQPPGGAEPRLGLEEEEGGGLVDLSGAEPSLPRSMRAFLETGEHGLAAARRWATGSRGGLWGLEVGYGVLKWVMGFGGGCWGPKVLIVES